MATGKLLKHRNYVRIETSKIQPDMTRYMAYTDVAETEKPQKVQWKYDNPWLHRIQRDKWTFFMRPSLYNSNWEKNAKGRYASFGVTILIVVDPFPL